LTRNRLFSTVLATALGTLLSAVVLSAGAAPLFSIEDPKGDDHGAGGLLYPNREDMHPGDLDLVRLEAERGEDGTWFTVELAQNVQDPRGRVTQLGQTPVDSLARQGFYTFNVDVYVDTDRIAGSGNTVSVPGRGVSIDRNFAWEKAIVLTPRPGIARTMLQMYFDSQYEEELRARQGRVSKEEIAEIQQRSERTVDEDYFFPTRVRVNNHQVEFFVPDSFLGGAPTTSWAYTALVTGADIEQSGRVGSLTSERPLMMTMPVGRGRQYNLFGIRSDGDAGTPPVVDLLASDPGVQKTVLDNYDVVAGRLAAIPGVAPDNNVALAASGAPATVEQAGRVDEVVGSSGAPAAAAAPGAPRTVPARLRTLNQLFEEGLITKDEYAELRRKILAEL
jgi:hypothetical protein